MIEALQPKPVKTNNRIMFRMRCLFDLQLSTIFEQLKIELPKLRGRVIDVGAGESPWCFLLNSKCDYVGLDIANSDDFLMQSSRKDITYHEGGVFPFPDKEFSAAICIETLEHVFEPKQMLAEILRVLDDGGTLLISVPWSARRHHIPYDFFRYTPEGLNQLLVQAGFVGIDISPRGSDAHVIANKLLIFAIGNFKAKKNAVYFLKMISTLFVMPMLGFWFLMSWINQWLGVRSDSDPLGYFAKAFKP
jgi:ubiquinone/menaquinone biosynthesis C-methylase UbiE